MAIAEMGLKTALDVDRLPDVKNGSRGILHQVHPWLLRELVQVFSLDHELFGCFGILPS